MKIGKKIYPFLVLLLLIILFFGERLIPFNNRFIGGIDVSLFFFWERGFVKEEILSGSAPLWNPYTGGGVPFFPSQLFYPLTFIYVVLPLPWAFNADILIHLYIAAIGMYCLVSLLSGSKSAGIVTGVVYCLSGYMLDRIMAGHIVYLYSAAYLPWIFFFIERAHKTKQMRFLIFSSIILGIQSLAADAQNGLYMALCLSIYYFIRFFPDKSKFNVSSFLKYVGYYFLFPMISFGLSAVQLLPYREFIQHCTRDKITYDIATFFSYPPDNFFTFLVPKMESSIINTNWEFSGYIGIFSLVLIGLGMLLPQHRKNKLIIVAILLILSTILLGHFTPFYHLYYKYMPLMDNMRVPARCILLFVFFLVILAGFGAQYLTESNLHRRHHVYSFLLIAVLSVCLLYGAKQYGVPYFSKEVLHVFGFLMGALLVLNIKPYIRNNHIICSLVVIAVFMDYLIIYKKDIPEIDGDKLSEICPYENFIKNREGLFRVLLPGNGFNDARAFRFRYYNANGYNVAFLKDYYRFMHEMAGIPQNIFAKHYLSDKIFKQDLVFSSRILNIKYAMVLNEQNGSAALVSLKDVMPRAFLVKDAIYLSDKEDHLEYLKNPDFDPSRQALLLASEKEAWPMPDPENTEKIGDYDDLTITDYKPNRIELASTSRENAFMVLSENHYPGWHAYVDGEKVNILRADYLLRAIHLPAGTHRIEFVYMPKSLITGAAITLFTIIILGSIITYIYKRH